MFYLNKVWGFTPEKLPFLGFAHPGYRNSFLGSADLTHDWVAIVCTQGDEPSEDERGRIMGFVRFSRKTLDLDGDKLRSCGYDARGDEFDKNGNYRWPHGLMIAEARRILDPPLLSDALGDGFHGLVWATSVRLIPDDKQQLAHDLFDLSVPVTLPKVALEHSILDANLEKQKAAEVKRRAGPAPANSRTTTEVNMEAPGWLYAMKLIGIERRLDRKMVYKLGYSNDVDRRLAEHNSGLFTGATGLSFELARIHAFDTCQEAYAVEQNLLRELEAKLIPGEQECILAGEDEINSLFNRLI